MLQKLKTESKKNVTKFSKITDIEYRSESIELFGETYVIKRVALVNHSEYNVGWVLDNQTKGCMRCNGEFNMMVWRHHCRSCGFVICSSCGDKKLNFSVFEEESPAGSRVCRFCYDSHTPAAKQQRKKKGPPTLVAQTPVTEEVDVTVDLSTTLVDNSVNLNATFDNETTNLLEARKEVAAETATQVPETKSYAPKLRPTLAASAEPSSKPARAPPVVAPAVSQSAPAPSLGAPQQSLCPAPMPQRKNRDVPTLTPSVVSAPAINREDELTLSAHNLQSLNSSAMSTGTKTIINTAYNATLVAPPPKRGQTYTVPEIFSPVQTIAQDMQGMETPPSCGSIGSGEVKVNLDRFGSPTRQKLIMEDARSNVIWEATDDDGTSTCSSAAPTPSSAISGTTSGGAGVGYIRSPWDSNSFSPYGSQQKPRRLMNTGGSSVGRSGGRSISKGSVSVKFAVDSSFSADAMADIAAEEEECEDSPCLALTREQLAFQQQYLRDQARTGGNADFILGASAAPAAPAPRAALRDVENVSNQAPAQGKHVQKNVIRDTKPSMVHAELSEENQVPAQQAANKSKAVDAGMPPLSKASRGTKAAPR